MIIKIKGNTVAYEIPELTKSKGFATGPLDLVGASYVHNEELQLFSNTVTDIVKWLVRNDITEFKIYTGTILEPIIEKSYLEIVFNTKEDMVYFITGF